MKRRPSSVWAYFEDATGGVTCTIAGCKDTFVQRTNTSTSGQWDHLQRNHKAIYDSLQKLPSKRKQPAEDATSSETPVKKRKTDDPETQIMKMLARRNVPFTMVDDPLFRRMTSITFPGTKIRGSRYYARVVLPKVAQETVQKLRSEVGDRRYAITTDGWTAMKKPSPAFYR
jgi:hypothetical protein